MRPKKLFQEFPSISTKEWKDKIITDLKGKAFDRTLVWNSLEGFKIQPFYRAKDLENLNYLDVSPKEFPFIRGTQNQGNNWLVRQDFSIREDEKHKDIKSVNEAVKTAVAGGVTSLGFEMTRDMVSTDNMAVLLDGIDLTAVEINFSNHGATRRVIHTLADYATQKKIPLDKIRGSVAYDPIGVAALKGRFYHSETEMFDEVAAELLEKAKILPNFRLIAINGKYFQNTGCNITQEIAYSLAQGATWLTKMTDLQVPIDDVANVIKFNLAVSLNYFMEIAKIRALRFLWATIVKAYQPQNEDSCQVMIHEESSRWNMTAYDPYVNMLRTQTGAMSAVLGGVDSLTVVSFNDAYEQSNDFTKRIARNQQLLLKEEAHFDKVADPGAGSYYIEVLTDKLIGNAWELFLEIDKQGGFLEALKSNFLQFKIKEKAQVRNHNVAIRNKVLLGSNNFPNFTERLGKLSDDVIYPNDMRVKNAEFDSTPLVRGAQKFEQLRQQTETSDKEPKVFMLTIGNLAMRRARAQFACNFFACAGYEVIDNNGFKTVEEGVQAGLTAHADIIVLCSSDDEYAALAPEAITQVGDKAMLVLAGYPKGLVEELKSQGLKHFIHVKSNVLEELREYNRLLNISE